MDSRPAYPGRGQGLKGIPDSLKSKELSFGSKLAGVQVTSGHRANMTSDGFAKRQSDRDEIGFKGEGQNRDRAGLLKRTDFVTQAHQPGKKNEHFEDSTPIKPDFYEEKEQSEVMANKYQTENDEIELELEESENSVNRISLPKEKTKQKRTKGSRTQKRRHDSQAASIPENKDSEEHHDLIGKLQVETR